MGGDTNDEAVTQPTVRLLHKHRKSAQGGVGRDAQGVCGACRCPTREAPLPPPAWCSSRMISPCWPGEGKGRRWSAHCRDFMGFQSTAVVAWINKLHRSHGCPHGGCGLAEASAHPEPSPPSATRCSCAVSQVRTRAATLDHHISSAEDISQAALRLLRAEPLTELRLMGLRMSNFQEQARGEAGWVVWHLLLLHKAEWAHHPSALQNRRVSCSDVFCMGACLFARGELHGGCSSWLTVAPPCAINGRVPWGLPPQDLAAVRAAASFVWAYGLMERGAAQCSQ